MIVPFRAASLLAIGSLLLGAQTAVEPVREVVIRTHTYTPPSAILHAETNLVETPITVRDGSGRTIGGLHASDFDILDNGVPQEIVAFSEQRLQTGSAADAAPSSASAGSPAEAVAPARWKFVTFFFDDMHVPAAPMAFVKQAARAFIANGVKPGDYLSIVTASGQGDLDFTNDPKLFAERLEHLAPHIRPVVPTYCGVSPIDSYIFIHNLDGSIRERAIEAATPCANCSDDSANCRLAKIGIAQQAASSAWEQLQAQSIDTMDALGFAAKRLGQRNGTRILVLTSSGFLLRPGVQPELQRFIDAAVRGNITVDAIDARGLDPSMGGPKGLLYRSLFLAPMENIARGTGGHFFKDTNDLAGAMDLAANPEVSYLLAFHSGVADGKFHKLKVRFRSKRDVSLDFRPGYFSPEPKKVQSARARMDEAVFSKDTLREIPTAVSLTAGEPKDGAIPVSVAVTVDVNGLAFTSGKGRHFQQLVFLLTLLDPNGGFVSGKESIMDLALTDEKLASLKKDGLKAVATLSASAGIYQVRTIVREGVKGSVAASTRLVEVRPR